MKQLVHTKYADDANLPLDDTNIDSLHINLNIELELVNTLNAIIYL